MKRTIAGAMVVACLCGCNTVKDGFVANQWSRNISELGMHPLFPPREDLYVGDVFLNADGDKLPADGLHLASLIVATELSGQYVHRPDLPASAAGSDGLFGAQIHQMRMKTVALPYFVRVVATGAEVGAFVPVDAMIVKAGFTADSVQSASVTISSASSISLPWTAVDHFLHDDNGGLCLRDEHGSCDTTATMLMLRRVGGYAESMCHAPTTFQRLFGKRDLSPYVDLFVVSEVYYGQTFDITLHVSGNAGAALGVTAAASAAVTAVSAAASSAGSAASAADTAAGAATTAAAAASAAASGVADKTTAASQAADAATASAKQATAAASLAASAAAAAINASDLATAQSAAMRADIARAQQLAPAAPGVSVTFGQSSSGDVGLRQTYDHPIAIGYRGVTFKVNLCAQDLKSGVLAISRSDPASFLVGPTFSARVPVLPIFAGTGSNDGSAAPIAKAASAAASAASQ
jgi:hypothetical protein